MTKSVRFTLSAAFLSPPSRSAAAQTRGVTAEDYFAFETLGDPHFSPDGATIAYRGHDRRSEAESTAQRTSGRFRPTARASRRALTTAPQSSTSPRWSPDGKCDGIPVGAADARRRRRGDHAARTQVWLLSAGGGEPRRVTNLAQRRVQSFQWSPDGTQAGRRRPQRSERHREIAERRPPLQARQLQVQRHAAGSTTSATHLWVVDVASGRADAAHLRRRLERRRSAMVAGQPRRSRSCPTAPARSSTRGATPTSG